MQKPEYTDLYETIAHGNRGMFAIRISVAATNLPDLKQKSISYACYDAEKLIEDAVRSAIVAVDPKDQEKAKQDRKDILDLFPQPIFVEEIPNGYGVDWSTKHLPWFVVTTTVGRIKIGWRRSVLAINWKETVGTKTAEELFAKEEVTKGEKDIHAWSYEDARRYIFAILNS